jgi:hypothetical protein
MVEHVSILHFTTRSFFSSSTRSRDRSIVAVQVRLRPWGLSKHKLCGVYFLIYIFICCINNIKMKISCNTEGNKDSYGDVVAGFGTRALATSLKFARRL